MKNKFYCEKCDYGSDKKSNFNKHRKTKKHLEKSPLPLADECRPVSDEPLPILDEINLKKNGKFKCEYCNEIFTKTNKSRHYLRCNIKRESEVTTEIKKLRELTIQLKEEIKDNEKKMVDMEKDMFDFMKTLVANNQTNITNNTNNTTNNKINNNNYNMYYIINNFTEAENIEDIMGPPLTKEELEYIHENGSILGSYKVITDRCITDKDVSKRPVHCTDIPRKKYLLRSNNEWIIDPHADTLLTMTFNKMQDAYDINTENIEEKIKNTNQLVKLDLDGRKKLNKQISKDVLLKNNVN